MNGENREATFLTSIIKEIVNKPDMVNVVQEKDNQGIKLTLSVDAGDMGKIIGSQGKTATAIRTIMHAYGGQNNEHVSVLIEEPDEKK